MKRKGIKFLSRVTHRISMKSIRYMEPHHGWVGPEHPPQQPQTFRDYREARMIVRTLRSALRTQDRIREQMHMKGKR